MNFKGISKDDWLTWGAWQFPLLWLIGLKWTLLAMCACSILGTLGGWQYGHKAFRWLGIPLVVCTAIYLLNYHHFSIYLAAPFMIKIAPSYGKGSLAYNFIRDDLRVRLFCFAWYWGAVVLALSFK